jgi:hypothetical protein
MRQLLPFGLALLMGCAGSAGDDADCLRPLDWRDALVVEQGSTGTVIVVEDCSHDMTVTSVSMIGAGWDADFPAVGDVIPAGTWTITVFHDGADFPGTYTGELFVDAEGVDPEPAKPLQYVIEDDTEDTGGG